MKLPTLVVFLVCLTTCFGWRIFHRGRGVGGNLGSPASLLKDADNITEKWFTQKLDHFTPGDNRRWEQVSN